jgi:hypothetical protein
VNISNDTTQLYWKNRKTTACYFATCRNVKHPLNTTELDIEFINALRRHPLLYEDIHNKGFRKFYKDTHSLLRLHHNKKNKN